MVRISSSTMIDLSVLFQPFPCEWNAHHLHNMLSRYHTKQLLTLENTSVLHCMRCRALFSSSFNGSSLASRTGR